MHVPDGIVPIWLQILLFMVSMLAMILSLRIIRNRLDDRLVPYMGVLAAVIFAAQLVNFPVPPFSSGHLVGSTLLAVMVGPWAGMVIIALVLFVQALYGDGGILTYGVNLFNMGVFSVFLGYAIAFGLFKILKRYGKKETSLLVSAAVASFIVTVSAAFFLGLELLLVPGFSIEALWAITGVHVVIGLGEAILTFVILLYFVKGSPQLISFLRESDEIEESEPEDDEEPQRSPLREVAPTIILTTLIIAFVILVGLASENPDGFEWALFVFAGVHEPEIAFEGVWSFLGEGMIIDLLTGTIGIVLALGLAFLLFRRATHKENDHGDKFLLPFQDGKTSPTYFSSAGMILTAIALAVIISLQSSLSVLLVIITLTLFVGGVFGTRWGRVISLAAKFEVVILFWVVLEPFLYGSTILLTITTPWGPIYAYYEGLYLGLLLGSRMFAILLVFLTTLSHLTLNDFIGGLRALRIPTSILGSLLIMFRYIPLFMEERSRMQDAQYLRGFSKGRRTERIRSLGYLVGTSISRSFTRGVSVYESMTLRGFNKGMMMTGSDFRRRDAALSFIVLIMIIGIFFLLPVILEVFSL